LSTTAAAYTALTLVLGVALAWCLGWWARGRVDHARRVAVLAERAARPPGRPRSAIDGVVAVAMAGWCCDAWAATAGIEHDPDHCTRKDQPT
jgi:hypothetical protein